MRRITGTTLGTFFRDEVGDPLGLDWWIGLPESEEPRVAPIIPPAPATDPEVQALMAAVMAPGTMLGDALTGPAGHFHYDEMWNTRAVHECELPSSNGIASAHAVSRMYAALVAPVEGVRILGAAAVARATATQIEGTDVVIGVADALRARLLARRRARRAPRARARSDTPARAGRSASRTPRTASASAT